MVPPFGKIKGESCKGPCIKVGFLGSGGLHNSSAHARKPCRKKT